MAGRRRLLYCLPIFADWETQRETGGLNQSEECSPNNYARGLARSSRQRLSRQRPVSVKRCCRQTARQLARQAIQPNPEPSVKRILWIIPNYKTFPTPAVYKPITPRQKLNIATADSFDRGTVILAAAFAGEGQLSNSSPSFGQGVEGYSHYFGAAYTDLVVGDYMTEAVFPTLLHQDPRYFRRGTGSGWSRLGYAMGEIFWTHTDAGGMQFNYSEIVGNATAVAISSAYYPDGRDVHSSVLRLGPTDRRRYGLQHPKRVLAGYTSQAF